jgi:hypothetical protein
MQKKRKKYVKKAKFRPGLTKMLPLIPLFPEWITTKDLAKKLDITTDRAISWIAGIPEGTPIAVDDLSKGVQKYCYIRDMNGKILI